MDPNVRRDLLVGGALVLVGTALLGFAFFASDEGFRAPRWVVGAIALGCAIGGGIPLYSAIDRGNLVYINAFTSLGAGVLLLILALVTAWLMIAVGPEGTSVTLDIPLPIPERIERAIANVLFYAVLGVFLVICLVGAFLATKSLLPMLHRTAIVAMVAPIAGLVAWVAIELQHKTAPPLAPVVFLSFDRRFPSDEYLSYPHGDEVVARPGLRGMGLFIGGNEDWLDVQAPRGYDTAHGLTLAFWMKRENWVNPYVKGSRSQTIASVEVEREWKGRPEIQAITFSLTRDRRPESFNFGPSARVGDVRLAPLRASNVPPGIWTHVAVVYDRFLFDRMRLYIDGKQVARAVPWGSTPGFADIRGLRIGTWAERNGAYRGMIDEVKVYARALSEDEISAEISAQAQRVP